jgi:hypothetical protein
MTGWSLPRIIQAQIERNSTKNERGVIRDTLSLIETQIRFQVARVFSCYNNILIYALEKSELTDLVERLPAIPLFLEVGASDQTMISFMALGLSRVAAMRLNESAVDKEMDMPTARAWLKSRPRATLDLSPLLLAELEAVLAS